MLKYPRLPRWSVKFTLVVYIYSSGDHSQNNRDLNLINMVSYPFDPNLVILAWLGDESLCGQTSSSELGNLSFWS